MVMNRGEVIADRIATIMRCLISNKMNTIYQSLPTIFSIEFSEFEVANTPINKTHIILK